MEPEARLVGEPRHGLLREILHAAAGVARPLVDGRVRAVVDGREGELVQPGRDVAAGPDVAAGLARPHRDPEHGVVAERHGAGERGDLAVVRDLEGDAAPALWSVKKSRRMSLSKTSGGMPRKRDATRTSLFT
jgi:hypothetical protein